MNFLFGIFFRFFVIVCKYLFHLQIFEDLCNLSPIRYVDKHCINIELRFLRLKHFLKLFCSDPPRWPIEVCQHEILIIIINCLFDNQHSAPVVSQNFNLFFVNDLIIGVQLLAKCFENQSLQEPISLHDSFLIDWM